MNQERSERIFLAVRAAIAAARGPANAITLARLAERCQAPRREVEQVIEERLGSFPWPVVAGSEGVYQPICAEQINRYLHSLHTRHRRMQLREATVRRKARAAGWPEESGRFVDPVSIVQQELFA